MDLAIGSVLSLLLAIAVVKAIAVISNRTAKNRKKLPAGPTPLPILGNLLELGNKPHKSLAKLAKLHGPLMGLKLGKIYTVVISSAPLAKEVLQTHDLTFANRSFFQAVYAHDHHMVSVAWMPVGPPWRSLRRICNSYLFSNQKLDASQDVRQQKVGELVANIKESCRTSSAVNIGEVVFRAVLNVISISIFSLDLTDSELDVVRDFKEVVRCIMEEVGKPDLADYFPILRKIDPQRTRYRSTIYFGRIFDLFDHLIDQRLQLRKEHNYISANDTLDTLLNLVEDNKTDMDRNSMKHLFLDLFVAGTDTTSSTVEWAMTELLRNPNTLSKTRAEIEQTIGKNSLLQESDMARLPYLKAIVKETFRLHPAAPLLLPRKAGADVEMNGCTVPKDAVVMVNAWAIGRDPTLWEDPELFRPERFLESEIDVKGQNFELIPFGGGRRICVGMPLAIRMLQLVLGSLIQSFDWKLEDGVTPQNLDMEDRFGISLQKAQPLRIVPIQL